MSEVNKDITYFAETNFRNRRTKFGIKKGDRTKHTYVIGKTGTGKTTLLENMAIQDIRNGNGVGIVDPHGSFAEKMLDYIPEDRIKDVVYFNPSDVDYPIAFNIMEDVGPEQRHLVASGLMSVFKKLWPDVWSPRMEYILNNSILALLEYPNATLLGVNRLLADKDFRKEVVANVSDPVVKAFWEQEFAKYTDRFAAEATPAIQNKVGQLTANPLIRNIIGQSKSSFDFRDAMDGKKILIMNLSKGRIGESSSNLIGAMLITKIYLAAMSRAASAGKEQPDFYLYVDEFQNFASEAFQDILSEARKYGLALILAHQYIAQMLEGVRDAVFGNVGTHIVFRVGPADAEVLEKEFTPEFTIDDIVNLSLANIYLKLSIDGVPSRPFSAVTLPPIDNRGISIRSEIIEASRKNYCNVREDVEKDILHWHEPIEKPKKDDIGEDKIKKEENKQDPPKLFEAECSVCGKKTVLPFEPDGKRPVFCQKHRSYISSPTKKVSVPADQGEAVSDTSDVLDTPNISLMDLGKKTTEFKKEKEVHRKKEKPKPDFVGLRELLSETGVIDGKPKQSDNNTPEKKVLKPGDSVNF